MIRYAVVIEKASSNYSAYVPDLPGCVATGTSAEQAQANISKAINMHLSGLAEDGIPAPAPNSVCTYVEADACI